MSSPYEWLPTSNGPYWNSRSASSKPKSVSELLQTFKQTAMYEAYGTTETLFSPYESAGYAELESQFAYSQSSQFSDTKSLLGRPLKVIHVGQCLVRAGIESWIKSLGRYFQPHRAKLTRCVVTSDFADLSMIPEMGAPVELGGAASVRRAAADCDVMLVSGPPNTAEWLEDVRPPLCIFVAHGDGMWTRQILDRSRNIFDHAVAVSQRVQKSVCHDLPATVIYHGIDTSHIVRSRSRNEVRQACGFEEDDFVLGYVGRFAIEKNAHSVIEAVSRLPRKFKALFVGWGPLRPQLMDLANAMIPGRYTFVAGLDHMGDYYAASDAVCLPSVSEGFGLALLEAMLCDRPIISGRAGFAPEMLQDRVHGLIVDANGEAVAQAASLLESNPQWAATMARAGKQLVESFGFARQMANRYEDLFELLWQNKFGKL